ncbi:hypothetical protein GJ744_009203 [Endocarpon pusillum]|uniref:Uncharacterized protein n=1 Tax=Endocarpon pusillum TaxID=364733 RepID=A0A8H7ANV5_9EURO|nr:hypothetical protein GJ744_009203 [Endocarpon pusillum]
MAHTFGRRSYGGKRDPPVNVSPPTRERMNRAASTPAATPAASIPAQSSLLPPSRSSRSTSTSTTTSTSISTPSSSSRSLPSPSRQLSMPSQSSFGRQVPSVPLVSNGPCPPPGRYSLRSDNGPASSSETSTSASQSLIDFYRGYGGFFRNSFEATAEDIRNVVQLQMWGLPLPTGQSSKGRYRELWQAGRSKEVEILYAEEKIVDEERKLETMAVSTRGGKSSGGGNGGGRGVSTNEGQVGPSNHDSRAVASGSGKRSRLDGARRGRK